MITKFKIFEEYRLKTEMDLPKDVLEIAELFDNNNKEIFLVGGSIRDFFQNKKPKDYDLTTNATPDETMQILKKYKTDLQGAKFGVVRVFTENFPEGIEIAAFRKDISKSRIGNEPKVEVGKNITINDDVIRRDFSINSLFYNIKTHEIIDLVGGIDDIKNNIIRAVGDPAKRFDEDRLRILRCMRFSARNKAKIDTLTEEAILKDNRLRGISTTEDVSQERINEEFNKMILSCKPNKTDNFIFYLELLKKFNLFEQMFPNININLDFNLLKNIKFEYPIIIYSILFIKNDLNTLLKKLHELKFSNIYISTIKFLITFYNNFGKDEEVFKLYNMFYTTFIEDDLIRCFCECMSLDKSWAEYFIDYTSKKIETKGEDLIGQGFKGSDIAKEKERLEVIRFKDFFKK